MQQKSNNNLVALSIGFFLILLIALMTFFRSSSINNSQQTDDQPKQNATSDNLKNATKISASDLSKKILGGENITIFDIRTSDSYAQEHLLNSKNIALPDLAGSIDGLDKEKTYIIIDSGSALESTGLAARTLADAGFKNIYYLDGGFDAWKSQYNATVSSGNPNSFTDQSKVTYIKSDKLKEMLASEKNLAIIDVRKSNQYAEGHINGAMNIFLDDLENRRNEIPIGKKIILYDNDGLWAFKAAVRLFDMGFFNTLALSDGLDTWKTKGYEIVK